MKLFKKATSLFNHRYFDYFFILFWIVLNLFQVATTELTSDEGYYWFYSSRIQWGYLDHPPMMALLTRAGCQLLHGELGVRIFHVLVISAGLFFILKILPQAHKKWFFLIALALPLFNYLSFFVFPDTALVAFSGLALYAYKNFLKNSSLKWSAILALAFALMLYSKYHALLFMVLLVASNLKLLKNRYFYLTAGLTLLLYAPHLLWQYEHGFPSFALHLAGRNSAFKINNLFEFLSQQLVFLGIGTIWIPFVVKGKDDFNRALKFIAIGTILFFAISTCRGFVQFHWTSIALFPILILSAQFYSAGQHKRWFFFTMPPFIVLILLFRLYLSFQIFPVNHLSVDYFHGRTLWAEDIRSVAGNKTVVFDWGNMGLKEAPLYSFYTSGQALPVFPGRMIQSQYQFWNCEEEIEGDSILLIRKNKFPGCIEMKTRMGRVFHYKTVGQFRSFQHLKLQIQSNPVGMKGEKPGFELSLENQRLSPVEFDSLSQVYVELTNPTGDSLSGRFPLIELGRIEPKQTRSFTVYIDQEKITRGTWQIEFGFEHPVLGRWITRKPGKLELTDFPL